MRKHLKFSANRTKFKLILQLLNIGHSSKNMHYLRMKNKLHTYYTNADNTNWFLLIVIVHQYYFDLTRYYRKWISKWLYDVFTQNSLLGRIYLLKNNQLIARKRRQSSELFIYFMRYAL